MHLYLHWQLSQKLVVNKFIEDYEKLLIDESFKQKFIERYCKPCTLRDLVVFFNIFAKKTQNTDVYKKHISILHKEVEMSDDYLLTRKFSKFYEFGKKMIEEVKLKNLQEK